MFGIPFVLAKAGFLTGLVVILFVGVLSIFVNLMVGELVLRSRRPHQLIGLAELFLGSWGRRAMFLVNVIGIYGALVAYVILVSDSLRAVFGGNFMLYYVVFLGLMAMGLSGGIGWLSEWESFLAVLKLSLLLLVLFLIANSGLFSFSNLTGFSLGRLLLPVGVVLFAYLSPSTVPEMSCELRNRRLLIRSIVFAGIIPVVVYFVFAAAIVGVTGEYTTEVGTVGVSFALGWLGIVLNLFAILAAATAFLGLGFALKESFCEDFGMSDVKSWFFTMIVPAVLVFVGVRSFWKVLEFVGGFTGGLLLILILLMHFKARKSRLKSEFVLKVPNWSYILLFALLGIIVFSSLWYMV